MQRTILLILNLSDNASGEKYSSLTPKIFLIGQIMMQNPVTLPLWLSGLLWFLFSKEERRFRLSAYVYLTALAVLLFNGHSKPEYLSAAYSMLFAGGGCGHRTLDFVGDHALVGCGRCTGSYRCCRYPACAAGDSHSYPSRRTSAMPIPSVSSHRHPRGRN